MAVYHKFVAGIVYDSLTGPFELLPGLTGANYLQFLRCDLPQLLQKMPVDCRSSMWFLHDGASFHFSRMMRRFLDANCYPCWWIGRGEGLVALSLD